jgi:hypothetical protein
MTFANPLKKYFRETAWDTIRVRSRSVGIDQIDLDLYGEGAETNLDRHVHRLLSPCMDYNYQITENQLERCGTLYPIGCKKLFERFEDRFPDCQCTCAFKLPKMYPSPVCHAIMADPRCYIPPAKREALGHFRPGPAKTRTKRVSIFW